MAAMAVLVLKNASRGPLQLDKKCVYHDFPRIHHGMVKYFSNKNFISKEKKNNSISALQKQVTFY